MTKNSHLAPELRALVKRSVELLGEVIERELGLRMYRRIENIRREMAELRGLSERNREAALEKLLKNLRQLGPDEQFAVAHAFSLMLELMNACESAYRAYKLSRQGRPPVRRRPRAVVYVLTAHPTEARAPANIEVFHAIQRTLTAALSERFDESFARERKRLLHELEIAWRLLAARRRKPRVKDEAEHIYSILLRDDNLESLLSMADDLVPVFIRTWVGGDKDGHPFVNEQVMTVSLQLARTRLLQFARSKLSELRATVKLVGEKDLVLGCARLERCLKSLRGLAPGDGAKVRRFHLELKGLREAYRKTIGEEHPALVQLGKLVFLFPALVVPLELRESSEILVAASRGEPTAIGRMVAKLGRLSRGCDPRWYARGLIISMASSLGHVKAAMKILDRELGGPRIPVIPLFEQADALKRSGELVKAILADPSVLKAVHKRWGGKYEVMLGYSDSAKEMGALASRIAIADAMRVVDRVCHARGVEPIFFHGSGGSIDRGGGSIREQTEWWPASSLKLVKATIQGEMVERTFAGREILRSGIEKLVFLTEGGGRTGGRVKPGARVSPAVERFAERASLEYRARIASPDFLRVIECATAYRYLQVLRMGSRPSARSAVLSVSSLRAIPWVLSWTQVRVLFPTWWGVGTAWSELDAAGRFELKQAFKRDPLFRSFVKLLGFTLAKVELPVWKIYLANSGLSDTTVSENMRAFERELSRTRELVRALSESRDLVWFRPWLGESVVLRSPMIHPLNLLQILALERQDATLIRETVTGIASGMMTTG